MPCLASIVSRQHLIFLPTSLQLVNQRLMMHHFTGAGCDNQIPHFVDPFTIRPLNRKAYLLRIGSRHHLQTLLHLTVGSLPW